MKLRIQAASARNRIYETIALRASRGRVWRALSDHREFGAWFGATFEQRFSAGTTVGGILRPSVAEADRLGPGRLRDRTPVELMVDEIEPDHRLAFRLRSLAVAPDAGDAPDPTTFVELQLENDPEGVVLTVTESFATPAGERRVQVTARHRAAWIERFGRLRWHVERSTAPAGLVLPRLVSYQVTEIPPWTMGNEDSERSRSYGTSTTTAGENDQRSPAR